MLIDFLSSGASTSHHGNPALPHIKKKRRNKKEPSLPPNGQRGLALCDKPGEQPYCQPDGQQHSDCNLLVRGTLDHHDLLLSLVRGVPAYK